MFTQDHGSRSAHVPTLETSNQIQIDDLVQRNHALEHSNKKLNEQLNSEEHRAKEALADIQKQQYREQQEWRKNCDMLISCHRLQNMRTISNLETLRRKLLQEEEATRREKVQRLQRDNRILMFQISEGYLEDRMADLKEEKEDLVAHYEGAIANLRQKLLVVTTERKAKSAQLLALEKERDQAQDKLSQLRQEYATLQVSAESGTIKLERITLQLEGAQTKNTELERANDEQRRSIAELKRQLEKWQDLDIKGNGEMEAIRKQKMELEVKMTSLRDRLQKQIAEKEKELEKMARKREKMNDIVQQWQDEANEQRSQKEKAEEALADSRRRIEQLETEMKALTTNRENSDEGYATNQSVKKRSPSPPQNNNQNASGSSRKANPRKPKSKLGSVEEVDEMSDATVQRASKGKRNGPTKKASRNGKGKAGSTAEVMVTENDSDHDAKKNVPKGKRVQKTLPNDDDSDVRETKNKPQLAKRSKGRSNTVAAAAEDEDSGTDRAPTKKRRKINIFSNPAEPTFAFMGNDIGIDIPTNLSPVKDTMGIPNRSTSASVMNRVLSKTFLKR